MTMISTSPALARPSQDLAAAVALFHSLSDGTRLAILQRLTGGEARVVDLTNLLGVAQSTVSAHLACLRECGLVTGRPQGRQMFYSLTRPELMDLLASAETLLAATGNAVALCPNDGLATDEDPDPANLLTHHTEENGQ
jgi:DNA-binding transcriptional ArsR family regulator